MAGETWMRRGLALVAPWVPFFLLWILIARIHTDDSVAGAAAFAVLAIGTAAVLAIPARKLCRATPWPSRVSAPFVLRHSAASVVFASIWTTSLYVYAALTRHQAFLPLIARSRVVGWQVLMGLWLYGLVVGLSYAVEIQHRADALGRRAAEAEARAGAARLDAIRARLHPHFLFNALHSVGVLIRSDPTAAEAAVEALGELLRVALKRDSRALVPLAEEWSFSRRYLDFERIRYGDRLVVSGRVDDSALDCLVPPFALQTLVENAVQHAISASEGGRIEVRIGIREGQLVIEVEDEGAPTPTTGAGEGHQYGLAALRERLAGLYGRAAVLEAGAVARGGFQARLLTPVVGEGAAADADPGVEAAS